MLRFVNRAIARVNPKAAPIAGLLHPPKRVAAFEHAWSPRVLLRVIRKLGTARSPTCWHTRWAALHSGEAKMINSWLVLPFQAARLGWETQTLLVNRWLQLAGMNPDGKASSAVAEKIQPDIVEMAPPDDVPTPAEATAPPVIHRTPSRKIRHVAQKVSKIHKKHAIRKRSSR